MDVQSKDGHCKGVGYKTNLKKDGDGTSGPMTFDSNKCMKDVKAIHVHSNHQTLSVTWSSGSKDTFHTNLVDGQKDACWQCDGCDATCHYDCKDLSSSSRRRGDGQKSHRRRRDPFPKKGECPCQ